MYDNISIATNTSEEITNLIYFCCCFLNRTGTLHSNGYKTNFVFKHLIDQQENGKDGSLSHIFIWL